MAETGLALQLFMSGDDDIIVKEGWRPHPGQPMPQMAGVFIGKQFGAGGPSAVTARTVLCSWGHVKVW